MRPEEDEERLGDQCLSAGEFFGIYLMTISAIGLVVTIINGINCIMNP